MAEPEGAGDSASQSGDGISSEETREPSGFHPIFDRYWKSVAALREFFSHLSPVVTDLDVDVVRQRDEQVRQLLGGAKREAVQEIMRFGEWMQEAIRERAPGSTFSFEPTDEDSAALIGQVLRVWASRIRPSTHRELLNRSILMSLVGYFEVLLADVTHEFYRVVPEATSNDDKVLSVNELKAFDSIEDAMQLVISQKVDDLLRGSVEDWEKFFKNKMKLKLKHFVPDWAQWEEIFQRRHIIVHAGAKVTRRYRDKVDWGNVTWPEEKPALQSKVSVDDVYLERALDIFEVSGLLLCQAVWKKLAKEEAGVRLGQLLADAVYPRLLSGHWYVAEHLSQWGEVDRDGTEEMSLTLMFNRWLCVKRQGRWEEVRPAVEAFDCSAKNPKFALALASLKEEPDEFFRHLPAAVASGITAEELREWPILEEVRGDARFAGAVQEQEEAAVPAGQSVAGNDIPENGNE